MLWSLLKLYSSKCDKAVSVPDFPAALEGLKKPWDHSALFNFYKNINAITPVPTKSDVADNLAETLASELSSNGDLPSAIYTLSHISKPELRKSLIQHRLDRSAAILPVSDTATSDSGIALWQCLTIDLKLPTSWIYMLKASFAASETNNGGANLSELRYLVAVEAWVEAHGCLVERVAPGFIIDEDYERLLEMCALFSSGNDPSKRVPFWHTCGEVFERFRSVDD